MKMRFYILGIAPFLLAALTAGIGGIPAYPEYFPEPVYNFENNPLSGEKIALGRALFYDPILSRDSSTSCASCHSPYNAFAHTDHDLSHGIDDEIGTRNAPALFNLAWQSSFMWDGASNHLDVQALAPISHPKEMGEDIYNVVAKLQRHSRYAQRFAKAFDGGEVSGERVLKALAQFQLTLVSDGSKYDAVQKGDDSFSDQESRGYAVFRQNCNSCHQEPLFSSYGFANNGLPVDSTLKDFGRGAISTLAADSLRFKIPSLRNLSYTFPYMHDGRFSNLREVLNHYVDGVEAGAAPALGGGLALSPEEKTELIAFLLTLNDPGFVFDPAHQFPRELLQQANISER